MSPEEMADAKESRAEALRRIREAEHAGATHLHLTGCAIREVREETGLQIRITGLIGTYTVLRF
jgi:8-oxo-dGTP pyrophosphatase MutT (NUDIX family)